VNKVTSEVVNVVGRHLGDVRNLGDKINSASVGLGSVPDWAQGKKDARDVLHWDSE
jgi:gamma-glutamylcysteine synthetase